MRQPWVARGPRAALRRRRSDCDQQGDRPTLKLLDQLGDTPNERFNAMNAGRRAVVYDLQHQRQVDVFIGNFLRCYMIDLASRIRVGPRTVPLAELLLTKLQLLQLNRKALFDIIALLYVHDTGDRDSDTINAAYSAQLLASGWGWWRTSRGTRDSSLERLAELGLDAAGEERARDRLQRLWARVEAEPKGARWRSRARIGERSRWHEEPEEVDHDRTGQRL